MTPSYSHKSKRQVISLQHIFSNDTEGIGFKNDLIVLIRFSMLPVSIIVLTAYERNNFALNAILVTLF